MSRIAPQPRALSPHPARRTRHATTVRQRRRGFTLLETAMATVIIGLAFTATLQLLAAGTVANRESTALTTAINLANNIHEASLRIPYDELEEKLQGEHEAVDSLLEKVEGMPGWTQDVDVSYVDQNLLKLTVPSDQPTSRITVTVRRNGLEVYRTSWITAAAD